MKELKDYIVEKTIFGSNMDDMSDYYGNIKKSLSRLEKLLEKYFKVNRGTIKFNLELSKYGSYLKIESDNLNKIPTFSIFDEVTIYATSEYIEKANVMRFKPKISILYLNLQTHQTEYIDAQAFSFFYYDLNTNTWSIVPRKGAIISE